MGHCLQGDGGCANLKPLRLRSHLNAMQENEIHDGAIRVLELCTALTRCANHESNIRLAGDMLEGETEQLQQ
jgi:hypothetical protein